MVCILNHRENECTCTTGHVPTSQISLQLPDVLGEVIKLDLGSLEEILRLRHREHTLICTGMLQQKTPKL